MSLPCTVTKILYHFLIALLDKLVLRVLSSTQKWRYGAVRAVPVGAVLLQDKGHDADDIKRETKGKKTLSQTK